MSAAGAFLELARPHHWVKNAFVLTGLLFGHVAGDPARVAAALAAAAAFCLMSSAVYALNDVLDRESDRTHPDKAIRPVARGAIGPAAALAFSALLALAGFGVGAWAHPRVAAILATYAAINVAYSVGLKRVPVVDVAVIAAGFLLRILAGTAGIGIEPSRWLLACALLLTLFLGFAKRRAELVRLADGADRHRTVLGEYSLQFLDAAVLFCAGGLLAAYAMYTIDPGTARLHGSSLLPTLPFVALGTFRTLYRLHFRGGGGDPTLELVRDPWTLLAAVGWVAAVGWLLA
ncbi:MAG: decaprenyl-phosphate phosphoribosyltransferase [Betaproteobacteria bacterium]|nr:decaprenyl-phosphate phosphoribosyltransferase [Betaproteobacteria bacterium]